jgi:medium-chain acyl-[acyl-carrier-protein] hydrolase
MIERSVDGEASQSLPAGEAGAKSWVVRQPPRPRARLRLFCFPHAGGNAWSYRGWSSLLPEEMEVCAVQLPGHGNRVRETPLRDFAALFDRLTAALQPELTGRVALFGHSMGALMVFELARWMRDRGMAEPVHVFVSGHNAPQLPDVMDVSPESSDEAIIDQLRQLNCMPELLLRSDELMRLVLPVMRADLAICESYVYRADRPLHCPLTVMGGLRDPRTDRTGLEAWGCHTEGPRAVRLFPGDHFFLGTDERLVVHTIACELAGVLRP